MQYVFCVFVYAYMCIHVHAPISVPPPHHQVQDFFAANPDAGSGTRAVLQAIEVIQGNIQWVNSNQNSLGTWLNWWNTP